MEVKAEGKRKSEAPHPEVYGARAAVGDYRLGGRGGVDGGQYAGSVLAMDVLRAVGDGHHHCDCHQLGEEKIVQRDTGIERRESIVKAKIHVTLKPGILDPQGKAIEHALETLGFNTACNVRVGKYMELELKESAKDKAEAQVKAMCEKLLANTIIEEYRYELQ